MASDDAEAQEAREAREAQEAAEEDLRIFETLCISSPGKVNRFGQRTSPPLLSPPSRSRCTHTRESTRTHTPSHARGNAVLRARANPSVFSARIAVSIEKTSSSFCFFKWIQENEPKIVIQTQPSARVREYTERKMYDCWNYNDIVNNY